LAFCSVLLLTPSREMSRILQQRDGMVQFTRDSSTVPSASSVDGMGVWFSGRRRSTFFNDLPDTRKFSYICHRLDNHVGINEKLMLSSLTCC